MHTGIGQAPQRSGILPCQDIKRLCDGKGLIQNADLDCFAPASYELRIGSYRHLNERRELRPGEAIEIPPHSFILTGTIETVHLPSRHSRHAISSVYICAIRSYAVVSRSC